ncbi:FlgD immunoglobulin-like domain containing protein [Candidatus Eisenbacteria bacterium]|uniref:FlgD immunoglobulin-like domain containing protein n=1 Tax=Eiseniibacteriota bacterium TaxID=2212470 RepID=A0ABV6YPD8_UNCEI
MKGSLSGSARGDRWRTILLAAILIGMIQTLLPVSAAASDFTIPKNHLLTDSEFGVVAWGPGSFSRTLGPDSAVNFTFIGLDTTGTAVEDDYPVAAVYGQTGGSHGSDFSNFSGYALQMVNSDDAPVWVILYMNTGFTNPNLNDDTFWEMPHWRKLDPGEGAIIRLDFDNVRAYNIDDNVSPHTTGSDGDTLAINAYDRTEVTSIGFQVMDQSGANDTVTVGIHPPDVISVDPGTAHCLNVANPCDTVSMVFNRIDTAQVRGYSTTFQLSSELVLCSDERQSIRQGTYLNSVGSTQFEVHDNGGGSYTVDCAILGIPCGATGSGTLFTVDVTGSGGEGVGSITVTSVTVRDCDNVPVLAHPGPPVYIGIDSTPPAPISDLAASQVKPGNPFGSDTTGIAITFTLPPDADMAEIYCAPYGNHPEYDDPPGAGSIPSVPGYPPPSPWVQTALTTSGQIDHQSTRDFWYYVAFAKDACGNISSVSNISGGTLNYHLGDVSDGVTIGHGDNRVTMADISLLGNYYWRVLVPGDSVNYLDVGPTTDLSVDARPTTDNLVNFEDLMMFAINFGGLHLTASSPRQSLEYPRLKMLLNHESGQEDDVVIARLVLERNQNSVKGIHAAVSFDAGGLELLDVSRGKLLSSQSAPLFFVHQSGNSEIQIDLAGLGSGAAIRGSGEIAVLRFHREGSVAGLPELSCADLRGLDNRRLKLKWESMTDELVVDEERSEGPSADEITILSSPNPFSRVTDIHFSLPVAAGVSLDIYDVKGQMVRTLVDGVVSAGRHSVSWDGRTNEKRRLAPGTYMSVLTVDGTRVIRKLTLLP